MRWFDLIFPLCMLVFPLVFLVLSPRGPADSQTEELRNRARGLTTLLAALTIVFVGVHLLLWNFGFGFARFMFVGFFPLWFGLAMPALAARNPDLATAHPTGSTIRRASLAPRDTTPLAPRWMWQISAAIGAVFLAGTALRPWGSADLFTNLLGSTVAAFEGSVRSTWLIAMIVQVGSLALLFPMLCLCMSMVRREPEPMDARSSPELQESYASLRRFKAQSFLWLFGIGMNFLFGACFMLMAWLPADSRTTTYILAIGGGTAGSALGIAGGVIGTIAGMRRARINALIRSLDAR
jgi:hypothetical protein